MVMRNLVPVKRESDWSPDANAFIRVGMRALAAAEKDGRGRAPEIPRERLLYAVWAMCYTGMQWRMLGECLGLNFLTVYSRPTPGPMTKRHVWGIHLTGVERRLE